MQPITTLGSPHNAMHSPSIIIIVIREEKAEPVGSPQYISLVLTYMGLIKTHNKSTRNGESWVTACDKHNRMQLQHVHTSVRWYA